MFKAGDRVISKDPEYQDELGTVISEINPLTAAHAFGDYWVRLDSFGSDGFDQAFLVSGLELAPNGLDVMLRTAFGD